MTDDKITTEELLTMRVIPEQRADLAAVQDALGVVPKSGDGRPDWADLLALLALLDEVDRAAAGGSNDAEIEALYEALGEACRLLGCVA